MIICLTTVEKKEDAERIAESLLKQRLCSCVSITKVSSSYWWNGKIEKAEEYLLIIKSALHLKDELERGIKAIHPYKVPEIIFIEGEARNPYLRWLLKEVKKL